LIQIFKNINFSLTNSIVVSFSAEKGIQNISAFLVTPNKNQPNHGSQFKDVECERILEGCIPQFSAS
jgi:hypothetical protein